MFQKIKESLRVLNAAELALGLFLTSLILFRFGFLMGLIISGVLGYFYVQYRASVREDQRRTVGVETPIESVQGDEKIKRWLAGIVCVFFLIFAVHLRAEGWTPIVLIAVGLLVLLPRRKGSKTNSRLQLLLVEAQKREGRVVRRSLLEPPALVIPFAALPNDLRFRVVPILQAELCVFDAIGLNAEQEQFSVDLKLRIADWGTAPDTLSLTEDFSRMFAVKSSPEALGFLREVLSAEVQEFLLASHSLAPRLYLESGCLSLEFSDAAPQTATELTGIIDLGVTLFQTILGKSAPAPEQSIGAEPPDEQSHSSRRRLDLSE